MDLKPALEAILYVAGDEGISKKALTSILEIDDEKLDEYINSLSLDYENRGLKIESYGDKIKFITKEEYSPYLQKLYTSDENNNLSPSALETLAIIAYNEPVTRITIDEIRGVSSAHIVRKLVFKNLIKEVGRSDQPGRPILYGVTDEFLDHFGLSSTKDLPKLEEKKYEDTPQDLFDSKYTEI